MSLIKNIKISISCLLLLLISNVYILGSLYKNSYFYGALAKLLFINLTVFSILVATIHTFFDRKSTVDKTINFMAYLTTYWIFGFIYVFKIQQVIELINVIFVSYSGLVVNFLALLYVPPVLYQVLALQKQALNKYDLTKLSLVIMGLLLIFLVKHINPQELMCLLLGLYVVIRHPRELLNRFVGFRVLASFSLILFLFVEPLSIMILILVILWGLALYRNMEYFQLSTVKRILSYIYIPAILYIIIWLIEPYLFNWFDLPTYSSPALNPWPM